LVAYDDGIEKDSERRKGKNCSDVLSFIYIKMGEILIDL